MAGKKHSAPQATSSSFVDDENEELEEETYGENTNPVSDDEDERFKKKGKSKSKLGDIAAAAFLKECSE